MADNQWYILMGQERQGPLSTHDIRFLISRKKIDGGTLIWSEGLGAWSRLREVEEFHPKHKDEPEPDPEQSEKPDPEKTPPPSPEPSAEFRWIQKVIPILLALGLVGAAVYVFVTGEPTEEIEQKTTSPSRKKRQSRTPRDLVEQLKRGDAAAKTRLIQAGSRSVPALIQALMEKGSPIDPQSVRAILIEIGPSSASTIGDLLEEGNLLGGIDLSKTAYLILVEVLGEFGGLTSVPALIVALGNPDEEVQAKAIEAIGKLDPAIGPALARHLTNPVETLSKRQKKNLAEGLGKNGSLDAVPVLQQAQRTERDAETIAALADAIEHITRNPRQSITPAVAVSPSPSPSQSSGSNENARANSQPREISIHVTATATATATIDTAASDDSVKEEGEDEEDRNEAENEQKAKEFAAEGDRLREQGKESEALEKYRRAYALHPIRFYLLIIFELEGDPLDRKAVKDTSAAPPPLPEIDVLNKVLLSEIYAELEREKPDFEPYSGSMGRWSGTAEKGDPFGQDGGQDLYIVRGESGQDFIAAVLRNVLADDDLGSNRTWRGTLQGFRVIKEGEESRMLPVLLVDKIE